MVANPSNKATDCNPSFLLDAGMGGTGRKEEAFCINARWVVTPNNVTLSVLSVRQRDVEVTGAVHFVISLVFFIMAKAKRIMKPIALYGHLSLDLSFCILHQDSI